MVTERQPRQDLVTEALRIRPQFQCLSEGLKGEIAVGIGTVILQLGESCGGRWNSVGFSTSRIIVSGKDYHGGHELARAIREKIAETGIQCKTIYPMVLGSIRDVVMMVQAGVDTLEELEKFRRQSKFGRSGGIQGREFHTNPIGPPGQRMTTLHRS